MPQGRISHAFITRNYKIVKYNLFCCFAAPIIQAFSQTSNLELCRCNLKPPLLKSLDLKNSIFPLSLYNIQNLLLFPLSQSSLYFLSLPFQTFHTTPFFFPLLSFLLLSFGLRVIDIFLKLIYSKIGNLIYSTKVSTETKMTVGSII